ncbi:MAG: sigma-54 dependent transcriptional regulator [Pseudoflavonifractor sp.]|nr:sigma-54 dependent transcriptional regulator [Alloprevotella sp.]MCM1116058.1 sigma-54 dependent transcriptional regulator [Pseudoflavonifractor sp.]
MIDNGQPLILIVDDDDAIRLSVKTLLKRAGYRTATAANAAEAIECLRRESPALTLCDMNFSRATSGREGLELLQRLKTLAPDMPVILMTAWGSIPLAVEGMRAGASDFITKPWGDNHRLTALIESHISAAGAAEMPHDGFDRSDIIGSSSGLKRVLALAERVAATDAPVLILGENGTGKELIAKAIHDNSPRRNKPFVAVNLGGIPPSLFESEMFGHVKGAFTGAVADREGRFGATRGGTIFLDEIGELDAASQVKLLRVLQEHSYEPVGSSKPLKADFRLVAATNADLPSLIAAGKFREDLFYRINLITLHLPPLRERRSDIPLLVNHFAAFHPDCPGFSDDALAALEAYSFPGNIRQLRNIVERAILTHPASLISAADLDLPDVGADLLPDRSLVVTERAAIDDAMRRADGNISRAAALLGITRQALYRRLDKLGFNRR